MRKKVFWAVIVIAMATVASQAIFAYTPIEKMRIKQIEKYNKKNVVLPFNIEKYLEELCDEQKYNEDGLAYKINFFSLSDFDFASRFSDVVKGKVEDSGYIREEYFGLKGHLNKKIWLTITLSEDGTFDCYENGKKRKVAIREYVKEKTDSQGQMDYWRVNKKRVFRQTVYSNWMNYNNLFFYETYKYDWYPFLAFDPHGIPVISSWREPTVKRYEIYMYGEKFLIEIIVRYYGEATKEVNLEKCQKIALEIINSVVVY
jgi:hypothetical protein